MPPSWNSTSGWTKIGENRAMNSPDATELQRRLDLMIEECENANSQS